MNTAQFDVFSAENIIKIAGGEITKAECFRGDVPVPNGPCDLRLGAFDNYPCGTCNKKRECPGHIGYIVLAEPVYNTTLLQHLKYVLSCICLRCAAIKLAPDSDERRKHKSLSIEKIREIVKNRKVCHSCQKPYPALKGKGPYIEIKMADNASEQIFPTPMIFELLGRMVEDEIRFMRLGYHPQSLMFSIFPVLDNPARPNAINGHQINVDKLSLRLTKILSASQNVNRLKETVSEDERKTNPAYILAVCMLQDEVNSFYTAAHIRKSATLKKQASRAQPGNALDEGVPLHARLKSKEGQLRTNLMGKRGNDSARSVITGDPNLDLDEVGVPIEIADKLNPTLNINSLNIDFFSSKEGRKLIQRVHKKKMVLSVEAMDDTSAPVHVSSRIETKIFDFRGEECPEDFELEVGDQIQRPLMDNDVLALNRQPTLWRNGLMSTRVRRMKGKTIRTNVCATPAFNADYDGDEMNILLPYLMEAKVELSELMKLEKHIISPQAGGPCIKLVQDCLTAAYLLTKDETAFSRPDAMQIYTAVINPARPFSSLPKGPKILGKDLFIASVWPVGMEHPKFPLDSKKAMGCIHLISLLRGERAAVTFISDTQRLGAQFFQFRGFSTGLWDAQDYTKALPVLPNFDEDTEPTELLKLQKLEKISSGAGAEAIQAMSERNGIKVMMSSGAKGKPANICQMSACVGQQFVGGERSKIDIFGPKRVLPHFTEEETRKRPEARGFVSNCFREGLNPQEYFFTAQGSREGMTDTSIRTAETGNVNRRMMKALENTHIEYDLTVRDNSWNVYQFAYGEDGYDPIQLYPPCNVRAPQRTEFDNTLYRDLWEKTCPEYLTLKDSWVRLPFNLFLDQQREKPVKYSLRVFTPWATKDDLPPVYDMEKDAIPEDTFADFVIECFAKFPDFVRAHVLSYIAYGLKTGLVHESDGECLLEAIHRKYHRALASPGEAVGNTATQSIGEVSTQASLNSVDGATVLLLKVDGKLVRSAIGDFADLALAKAATADLEMHPHSTEFAWLRGSTVEVLAGQEDGSVSWQQVRAVTRHPVITGKLLEVRLKSGRLLRATAAKSFVTIDRDKGKLVPTLGSDLKVGDLVPVAIDRPEGTMGFLDVKHYLPPHMYTYSRHVQHIIDTQNPVEINSSMVKAARKCGHAIPIQSIKAIKRKFYPGIHPSVRTLEKIKPNHVYTISLGVGAIPDMIPMDFGFGWLCGIYIARGSVSSSVPYVTIRGKDAELKQEVLRLGARWGASGEVYKKTWTSIHSRVLSQIFFKLFGRGRTDKRLDVRLFDAPDTWIAGFLSGYLDGDGVIKPSHVEGGPMNRGLADDILALTARFGALGQISALPALGECKETHTIIWSMQDVRALRPHLNLVLTQKMELLNNLSANVIETPTVVGGVIGDDVVEIKEIPWSKKVYDLTVDGFKTFNSYDNIVFYDTFHAAGAGKSLVVSGFPQLKRLIDASQKTKSVWRIFLRKEAGQDRTAAFTLAHSLRPILIKTVIKSAEVHYGIAEEDKDWVETWKLVYGDTIRAKIFNDQVDGYSKFNIRFKFVSKKWAELAYTKLVEHFTELFFFLWSTDTTVLLFVPASAFTNGDLECSPAVFFERMATEIPATFKLCGLSGVTSIYVNHGTDSLVTEEGADPEYYLEMEGGNIHNVSLTETFDMIDTRRSYSANPVFSQGMLGIDAAGRILHSEFKKVFLETSPVDNHHVSLLVSFMTHHGAVMGMTRHTQNKTRSAGPIERCTNEQGLKVIADAAVNGRKDELSGVSARVMLGRRVKAGTGLFDVLHYPN